MRDIDYSKPEAWNDEDKEWLRQRIDKVPPEYHEYLQVRPAIAPAGVAETVEIDRLRAFLVANFPDEMATGLTTDTPVGVAIRLLSDEYETTDGDEADTDDTYDSWKVAELQNEVSTRRANGEDITPASDKKADLITALRASDSAKA